MTWSDIKFESPSEIPPTTTPKSSFYGIHLYILLFYKLIHFIWFVQCPYFVTWLFDLTLTLYNVRPVELTFTSYVIELTRKDIMPKNKYLYCEVNVFYNKGMKLLMHIYVSIAKISS